MKVIRWILGRIILFLDAAISPRQIERAPAVQAQIDERCSRLALYQFEACPFCVKVRRAIRRMGLKIQLRDAQGDARYAEELLEGGGQRQVPCLRIQEEDGSIRWMYESSDIIAYLESRFAV